MKFTREAILALLSLGAFMVTPALLRIADPLSRSIDLSHVHLFLFNVTKLTAALFITYVVIQIAFPTLDKYTDRGEDGMSPFGRDFGSLPAWGRVGFLLIILLFLIHVLTSC